MEIFGLFAELLTLVSHELRARIGEVTDLELEQLEEALLQPEVSDSLRISPLAREVIRERMRRSPRERIWGL